MQKMPDKNQILKLAQSPAGQKLLGYLKNADSSQLQSAVNQANAGNYAGAKDVLSSLLTSPEVQKLLQQLEKDL